MNFFCLMMKTAMFLLLYIPWIMKRANVSTLVKVPQIPKNISPEMQILISEITMMRFLLRGSRVTFPHWGGSLHWGLCVWLWASFNTWTPAGLPLQGLLWFCTGYIKGLDVTCKVTPQKNELAVLLIRASLEECALQVDLFKVVCSGLKTPVAQDLTRGTLPLTGPGPAGARGNSRRKQRCLQPQPDSSSKETWGCQVSANSSHFLDSKNNNLFKETEIKI